MPWLDDVAKKAQPPVQGFFSARPQLHNAAWTSALALDLVGAATGSAAADGAADGALAVGIAGALPAAVTGTADWRDLIGEERRIATVHALSAAAMAILRQRGASRPLTAGESPGAAKAAQRHRGRPPRAAPGTCRAPAVAPPPGEC